MVKESLSLNSVDELAGALTEKLGPQDVKSGYFRGFAEVAEPISLKFSNLGLTLKGSDRVLLEGVTGEFSSGRVSAIMGPSGAGKTTLLNTLCGKATYGNCTGSLLINGEEKTIDSITDVMGFVPQEDIVHEQLTVRENLMCACQLKHGFSQGKKEIVEDVLRIMQMSHIQESIVGGASVKGISGGQRKRVNIGMELVGVPTVLFLDEPTSGLDSTTSLSVVHSLSLLARLNMTVIMVIHQPRYSLFTLLDEVCLLGVGGWTAYFGSSEAALGYFTSIGYQMPANENPADFFMDAISGEVSPVGKKDWKASNLKKLWVDNGASVNRVRHSGRSVTEEESIAILKKGIKDVWTQVVRETERDSSAQFDAHLSSFPDDETDKLSEEKLGKFVEKALGGSTTNETLAVLFKEIAPPGAKLVAQDDLFAFLKKPAKPPEVASDQRKDTPLLGSKRVVSTVHDRKGATRCIEQFLGGTLHRRLITWWRSIYELAFYCGLAFFCAVIMGIFTFLMLQDPGTLTQIYAAWIFQMITAMLVAIKCSFVFEDKQIFWRERNRGMSVTAFFFARVGVDFVFAVLPMTIIFITVFYPLYALANPDPFVSFVDWLIPTRLLTFVASGWGYLVSALLPSRLASVGSVIVVFIVMAVGSPPVVHQFVREELPYLELVVFGTITRWSTQWIGIAIYNGQIAETAHRCMDDSAWNSTKNFTERILNWAQHRCENGTFDPFAMQDYMSIQLKNPEYNATFLETMKGASDMMSSRVKDAYMELGLLHGVLDSNMQTIVMLTIQAFCLYFATWLALKLCNRDKQI